MYFFTVVPQYACTTTPHLEFDVKWLGGVLLPVEKISNLLTYHRSSILSTLSDCHHWWLNRCSCENKCQVTTITVKSLARKKKALQTLRKPLPPQDGSAHVSQPTHKLGEPWVWVITSSPTNTKSTTRACISRKTSERADTWNPACSLTVSDDVLHLLPSTFIDHSCTATCDRGYIHTHTINNSETSVRNAETTLFCRPELYWPSKPEILLTVKQFSLCTAVITMPRPLLPHVILRPRPALTLSEVWGLPQWSCRNYDAFHNTLSDSFCSVTVVHRSSFPSLAHCSCVRPVLLLSAPWLPSRSTK